MKSLRQMVFGILLSKSIFINQIASVLGERISLRKTVKRMSAQYLKASYGDKILSSHIESVSHLITENSYLVWDGTDIAKSHAKYLEGLEYVYDADKKKTSLGYNVLNINAVSSEKEITPLFSRSYSYQMGALSSNKELKKASEFILKRIDSSAMWVLDRGADNNILKEYFITEVDQFIIRLKKTSKFIYKNEEIRVDQLSNKIQLLHQKKVMKSRKNTRVQKEYYLGLAAVHLLIKGEMIPLYIMITRNDKGGLAYFLVKSLKKTTEDLLNQAFKGYGYRWSIEEYHRHVKQEYGLEKIQMRTYKGLQSVLAILTVAMNIIYNELKTLHFNILLDSGINLLNKNSYHELINFIYYKVSKIVAILLANTKILTKIEYETKGVQQQFMF